MTSSEPSQDEPIKLARHMALAIVAPVVMLIIMGGALAWQVSRMSEAARWVSHTNEVIAKFIELRMRLSDKESSLRGYLLSGDPAHRETFDAMIPQSALEEAKVLTRDSRRACTKSRRRMRDGRPKRAPRSPRALVTTPMHCDGGPRCTDRSGPTSEMP